MENKQNKDHDRDSDKLSAADHIERSSGVQGALQVDPEATVTELGVVYYVKGEMKIYKPGSPEERAMLWKIDLHMFTCVCTLYLLNYLDRTNIGNAKIGGMQKDLDLSSSDYSLALLIFFVGYLLGEIPSNMILSRVQPSYYLPSITLVWGLVATLMSQVHTKHALVGIRFTLGLVESGFFCGVLFLLSSWYRKAELARRMSFLYAAAILSGAFGGLLAGGVIDGLEGARGIRGWRWLFIIEGSLTMTASIIVVFILPDWPATTSWLTDEQKALAAARIKADHVGTNQGPKLSHVASLWATLLDWRTYLFTLLYTFNVGAGTITYFIPTLTTNLGYTGRKAQFMTVPVYAVTLVIALCNAWSADRRKERAFHIAIPSAVAGLMYLLSIPIRNTTAQYVFLCFGLAGTWGALPVVLAWVPNVVSYPNEKRAVTQAFVNMIANLASVYGSYLWPSNDAPRYIAGLATTSAFCFGCSVTAVIARFVLSRNPYKFNFERWGGKDEEPEVVTGDMYEKSGRQAE